MNVPQRLWTIGHSTHSIEAFLAILGAHGIKALADVRLLPGSRRHPQYNAESLAVSLREHSIEYISFHELGGRRRPRMDSRNTAWRNSSFRGYADYMETPEFKRGIERLESLAGRTSTAIMCAEALWWKCHRALISDYEKARGVEVLHILSENKIEPHPYTSAAKIILGELSYGDSGADATTPELWPV
jgi:uncharacterized protein (DUF488 family)